MCHFCADSSGPRAVEVAPDSRNASHATRDQTCTYLSSFLMGQIGSLRNSSDALPAASCATHSHHRNAQAGGDGLRASAGQLPRNAQPTADVHPRANQGPTLASPSPPRPRTQAPSLASSKARRKLTPATPVASPPFQNKATPSTMQSGLLKNLQKSKRGRATL